MTRTSTEVRLAARPKGWVEESCFRFVEAEVADPSDGEILVRCEWLSLDPYMRGRMNEAKSYAPRVELDEVMVGGAAGEVVASRHPGFAVGDRVLGPFGWRTYALSDGTGVTRADTSRVPLSAHLGAAGMPGITAYVGLFDIGAPKAGETVVVSSAAGAVGSVVGQLAKIRGCRAVGVAGGRTKCQYVVEELGFDACVDYKAPDFRDALRETTKKGVDVYFDNVGGPVLDAVLGRLNPFARIPLCGLVSQYNATEPYALRSFYSLLANRVKLQGFIITDHLDRWPEAKRELTEWIASGRVRYRESIVDGIRNAPRALIGMLRGENLGKQLVRLA
jgi:NADPH-dependent curcumin reductase CurA